MAKNAESCAECMSGNKSTNLNCRFSKSAHYHSVSPFDTIDDEILQRILRSSPVVSSFTSFTYHISLVIKHANICLNVFSSIPISTTSHLMRTFKMFPKMSSLWKET